MSPEFCTGAIKSQAICFIWAIITIIFRVTSPVLWDAAFILALKHARTALVFYKTTKIFNLTIFYELSSLPGKRKKIWGAQGGILSCACCISWELLIINDHDYHLLWPSSKDEALSELNEPRPACLGNVVYSKWQCSPSQYNANVRITRIRKLLTGNGSKVPRLYLHLDQKRWFDCRQYRIPSPNW